MDTIDELSVLKGDEQDIITEPLYRLFEKKLLNQLEKTALIFTENDTNTTIKTTYKKMNEIANQWSRLMVTELKKRHVKPNNDGDYLIAISMPPSDQLVIALMAIWKSGAAYLPIDPNFPVNRIEHILNESRPIMVLHDGQFILQDSNTSIYQMSLKDLQIKSSQLSIDNLMVTDMLIDNINIKQIAIVLYTSGSTGIPKGVRLSYKVILNRLQWQWRMLPYSSQETVGVFKTALTFVDSVSELWGPLLNILSLLILPKAVIKNPERLVTVLEEYKIRRLVVVPTLLRSLLMYLKMITNKSQTKLLYGLNIWVCSGETLPLTVCNNFFDYFEEGLHILYNFYGSTEVMGDVTYFPCKSKQQLSKFDCVPIGAPISNTIIYLLNSDKRPVHNGEIGEIFVSGLNLANGYVNNRDHEKFIKNPLSLESKYLRLYRTGDYGRILNGNIMYEGRIDSQIKIRGHRVDLTEVEQNILGLDNVEKCVVLCYKAEQIDQALLAFVKLSKDSSSLINNELQLEKDLKYRLADYMIPQIILIDEIPLLVNGKVDRQSLLKLYETNKYNEDDICINEHYDYTNVPEKLKPAAKDLFETIDNVIGHSIRNILSIHSNFYELGGNSLNSIYTVTLLREKGYNIGISQFISAKNLEEILYSMAICRKHSIKNDDDSWQHLCPHLHLTIIPLQHKHKNEVIRIIVDSFYDKADLEQWLKPDIYRKDYSDLMELIWPDLVSKNLSFIVFDRITDKIIATSLNFDARDEPEVEVKSKLTIIFEFLEYLEGPIRDNCLPPGLNKIFHSFMMATHADLNAQENIACMQFMEHEVLRLAKAKQFVGILTTNTSPLTQQLGNDVYKYKTMLDFQVNEYVFTDGTRPFAKAPNSQRSIVHWKEIIP